MNTIKVYFDLINEYGDIKMKNVKRMTIILTVITMLLLITACSIKSNVSDRNLYAGIKNGNLEQVKEGLQEGANINKIEGMWILEPNPIKIAIQSNKKKIAEYLLEHGADANYVDNSGISLLMYSAYNTNLHFCELLLQHKAKVNITDNGGYTALEYALDNWDRISNEKEISQIITLLIAHGAKIQPKTLNAAFKHADKCRYGLTNRILKDLKKAGYKSGLNELIESAISGDSNKVDYLIKNDKMKKDDELQVLFYTAAFGKVDTIKNLLKKGLDLKTIDLSKNTLLIIASKYGNLDMVKYLLNKGLNIEAQNNDSDTALIAAVKSDNYDIVKCLIIGGADIKPYRGLEDLKDALFEASSNGNMEIIKFILSNGYPISKERLSLAMGLADENNHFTIAKYFISKGANIDLEYNTSTSLEDACLSGNLNATKFLIENGADVNGKSVRGEPLYVASSYGNIDIVRYLIKMGADVNGIPRLYYEDKKAYLKGDTSLNAATMSGYFDIVKFLVESGADLHYKIESIDNNTVLMTAASRGSKDILEYLIKKGSEINYQNQKGQTALMFAISSDYLDNVEILLKYKANTKLKDKDGHTALDIAKQKKDKAIVQLLENAK
jgi:ankyrin repeat protein